MSAKINLFRAQLCTHDPHHGAITTLKAPNVSHNVVDSPRTKDHYNVKLLKGYGVSINLKDNRLCLKGGRDPFTGEQDIEEWFVSQIPYERIVISGKGYLSTEAVKLVTDHNTIILTYTFDDL